MPSIRRGFKCVRVGPVSLSGASDHLLGSGSDQFGEAGLDLRGRSALREHGTDTVISPANDIHTVWEANGPCSAGLASKEELRLLALEHRCALRGHLSSQLLRSVEMLHAGRGKERGKR